MPMAAAGPLGMSMGTVSGMTRRGPSSLSVSQASSSVHTPPMPVAHDTAVRSGSVSDRPASSMASRAEMRANWLEGSSRLAWTRLSFSGTTSGSTVAAKSTVRSYFSAQSLSRVRTPDFPASSACQVSSTVAPKGVTAPIPVTTTFGVMVETSSIVWDTARRWTGRVRPQWFRLLGPC
ncbi:Uncharacterised protein [Mycobacteroides abscessus subsp. abscessus]|nr:Uncharacterised protein [Mycobacteroides abscessus subsp. abscessus]